MEKFELIDTKEKFELKVNGEPMPYIVGYKIEATPFNRKLNIELNIPKEEITVQLEASEKSSLRIDELAERMSNAIKNLELIKYNYLD